LFSHQFQYSVIGCHERTPEKKCLGSLRILPFENRDLGSEIGRKNFWWTKALNIHVEGVRQICERIYKFGEAFTFKFTRHSASFQRAYCTQQLLFRASFLVFRTVKQWQVLHKFQRVLAVNWGLAFAAGWSRLMISSGKLVVRTALSSVWTRIMTEWWTAQHQASQG